MSFAYAEKSHSDSSSGPSLIQTDGSVILFVRLWSNYNRSFPAEIVSTVFLKDSKLRWKGIYNKGGEIIDFYMRDEDFKRDMVEDKIAFTSGMCIDCVLEIDRKLNEIGEIVNVSYSVVTVIKTRFDKMEIITPQGKKHLKKLEAEKQQLTLDLFA